MTLADWLGAAGHALAATAALLGLGLLWLIRARHMDKWLPSYLSSSGQRKPVDPGQEIHVLLCICDHYEPKAQGADKAEGLRRVQTWVETYPRQFGRFRDSTGRPPRHSFFFPAEEYEPEYLELLGQLCRAGFGEVEVHLHHDNDTPDNLRRTLLEFRDTLIREHGMLARHRDTGAPAYGFIHGNWGLCNCWPDGRWCGVDNELQILSETGCYADLTFPSAPSPTQPPNLNAIYYACNQPGRRRSHETAYPLGQAPPPNALLMVHGPLMLNWHKRRLGLLPATENSCLQNSQLPSVERLDLWLRARVQVPQRPDWFFVKLHAHGAPPDAHEALLGEPMVRFHQALADRAARNPKFHYHYVTARELVNLVKAAEAGFQGKVAEALDYEYLSNLSAPNGSADDSAFHKVIG